MLSFPFNSSTTVFYYNKDAFKKAGLDPNKAPEDLAGGGAGRGEAQGRGPAVPVHDQLAVSWTQLESFSAWHNTLFATQEQRLRRHRTRGSRSIRRCTCATIENLANMSKQGLFIYKGRGNAADATFSSGECAMMTGVIGGACAQHPRRSQVRLTASRRCPITRTSQGAPQNTVIGGASLWVMAGKKPAEYKGVATFFDYPVRARSAGRKATGARATCRSRRRLTS